MPPRPPKNAPPPAVGTRRARQAFTLIEVLVATAVLALLVLLIASILQSGSVVISGSRKHLGADAEAREVFSQFGLDLARKPRRADLDVLLSASNNALFFYSEAPGFQSTSDIRQFNKLSLVGYRVNDAAQLERLGKGLTWDSPPFLTYAAQPPSTNSAPLATSTIPGVWGQTVGSAPVHTDGADANYHLLAKGVFRLFYCFQKTDGSLILEPTFDPTKGKLAETSALILTLAVLDDESRRPLSDITKLATALPTPTQSDLAAGRLPAEVWQAAVNNNTQFASAAGIPAATAARVRIYQRSFPLDPL
jgi:prepilin-type N-terminal cleavage/methylation domain-containing protein